MASELSLPAIITRHCGCLRRRAKPARQARAATTTSASASIGSRDYDAAEATFAALADEFPALRELAEYNRGLALRAKATPPMHVSPSSGRRSSDDDKIVALANAQLGEIGRAADQPHGPLERLFFGRPWLRRQRCAGRRVRSAEQHFVIESARGGARRADARFRAPCRYASMRAAIPFSYPDVSDFDQTRGPSWRSRPTSGSGRGCWSSGRRSGAARSMATGSRSSSAPICGCAAASARASFRCACAYDDADAGEIRVSPTSTATAR